MAALLLLAGCGKEDSFRTGDQYVGRSGRYVLSVHFDGWATVFEDGRYLVQDRYAKTEGEYPLLHYEACGVSMDCAFTDPSAFTATLTGKGGLDLPDVMTFRRSDTPLDADGDGILDETR